MAIKIPSVPEIEDAAELINLVSGSSKFKERMTTLLDIYAQIKKGLEMYTQYQDIDSKFGEAQALVAEAKAAKLTATKHEEDARERAETSLSEMDQKRASYEKWQSGVRDGQEARDKALDNREQELVKRESEVEKVALTAKFTLEQGTKLVKDNTILQEELHDKLGKLRAITV